ncbi:MAG: NAD-dependent epimerase/dehydratase family protein [Actinomycetia bacterium]|nr:NAD-dependent epimerase/dehydratase family protein [Actinomycetes bacterium]
MRILVTGGLGFIGRKIVLTALEGGHEVRILDRTPALPSTSTVDVVTGDVTDAAATEAALDGIDVVCHQAAKVGLGVNLQDMPAYVSDNDGGTAVLLAAMHRAGVDRLVLASSMVVYGEGRYDCPEHGRQPAPPRSKQALGAGQFEPTCELCGTPMTPGLVQEDAPLDPRNAYAASKIAQEHLTNIWANQTGGRAIALRYHNVYGPGMPQDTPYAGVASIFRSALLGGEAPQVFEDGQQRRDFVHVADVARANIASINAVTRDATAPYRAYNVGSGEVRSVHDMARALAEALDGPEPVVTGQFRLGDVRHITADSHRLGRELGWIPGVSFADGMRELAAERSDSMT